MFEALVPGGILILIEYRAEDPRVPIKPLHKMSEVQVLREASPPEFGLQWDETNEDLPRQHVIFFERVGPNQ